jgi:hypothetical protein
MVNKVQAGLAAFCLGVVVTAGPAFADVYTLELYNTDDLMTAYISNSGNSDNLILSNLYGDDTGPFNFSSSVTPGPNVLNIQDFNDFSGWTYGYIFQVNGITLAAAHCGTVDSFGCDNDEQVPNNATVFNTDISFDVNADGNLIGGVTVTTTPLPATWTMLMAGFLGLGFFAYRGTKKNVVALSAI